VLAYEKLNELYQTNMGAGHTCPIRLLSIDFKEINELLPFQMKDAADRLLPYIQDIDSQKTICTIMLNNTLHQALDLEKQNIGLEKPIGHIGHLLNEYLERKNADKVMILGSLYTMNSGYLNTFFPDTVDIIKPEASIQRDLELLRKTYYQKEDNELAEQCFNQLLSLHLNVDIFIVACTEISLAFSRWTDSGKWVDSMDLQCAWAINKLMNEV
jgi:aspartate/glutamate racemase